jgi:hypothetical protein
MMFDPINFINREFNRLHTKSSIEIEIDRRSSSAYNKAEIQPCPRP